jgi:hypothetical protein
MSAPQPTYTEQQCDDDLSHRMESATISEPETPQVATASKPSNEAEPKVELTQDMKSAVTSVAESSTPSTSVETSSEMEQTCAAYEDNLLWFGSESNTSQ